MQHFHELSAFQKDYTTWKNLKNKSYKYENVSWL